MVCANCASLKSARPHQYTNRQEQQKGGNPQAIGRLTSQDADKEQQGNKQQTVFQGYTHTRSKIK